MTTTSITTLALAATMAALLGAAQPAAAQAFDAVHLQAMPGGTVGLAAIGAPEYLGSDQRKSLVLPTLSYQWANGWFAGIDNGVGYNFSKDPTLQYGARLTADLGRQSGDVAALRGMGDVDAQAEIGGFLTYRPAEGLSLTSSLRYGSGKSGNGALLDLGVGYALPVGTYWRLGARISATVADQNYMQSYFGVDAQQETRSGYAVYTPEAGLRDARVGLSLTYLLAPRTFVTAAVSSSALGDGAKASPVTRSTSSNAAVLALTYAF